MKRMGWAILTFVFIIGSQFPPAYALDTVPSAGGQVKINSPLLITAYSFIGHSLRFVQLYNSSDHVVSLDDWGVSIEYAPASQQIYTTLAGTIAPGKYVTVANAEIVPTATFTFHDSATPTDPLPTSISLLAPLTTNFNNEVASPTITPSTPRVVGTPATFTYSRNVSSSTGNFLTSFTAFIPSSTYNLVSDGLYVAPPPPSARMTEIYPDARTCSPIETDPTCMDYVKLHNTSDASIDLSQFRLRTGQYGSTSTAGNTENLRGVLGPGQSASFALSLSASGSWIWLEDVYGTTLYDQTLQSYPSSSGHDQQAWSDNNGVWQWTAFPTPGSDSNTFAPVTPVNQCSGVVINEIVANVATEDQYVELFNPSDTPIDLTGCIIQTNRSTTSQYVFTNEMLAPSAYRTVYIKDTGLTLTKTTTGTVYILSSDGMIEADSVTYENLAENTAWARVAGDWVQTYAITPATDNAWEQYPPCETGYVRNLDTGLCNKVTVTAVPIALDCGVGKERNPDTNRCRSIISTSSLLTPCAANQERNPETNRCRTITASATDIKPCPANQERNPDTNRCRNIKNTATTADFPVQAVAQSGQATLGWWAFGGVGMLAVGYAGWEWRREALAIIKKATGLIANRF